MSIKLTGHAMVAESRRSPFFFFFLFPFIKRKQINNKIMITKKITIIIIISKTIIILKTLNKTLKIT